MVSYSTAVAILPLFLLVDRPGASYAQNMAAIFSVGPKTPTGLSPESGQPEYEQACDCDGLPTTGWGGISNFEISLGDPSDHYTHVCNGGTPSWVNTDTVSSTEHWEGDCSHGSGAISDVTVRCSAGFRKVTLNDNDCVNVVIEASESSTTCMAKFYNHCNNDGETDNVSDASRLLRQATDMAEKNTFDLLRGGLQQHRKLATNPFPATPFGPTSNRVVDIAVTYTWNALCHHVTTIVDPGLPDKKDHSCDRDNQAHQASMCASIQNAIDETNESLTRSNVLHSSGYASQLRMVRCALECGYQCDGSTFYNDQGKGAVTVLDDSRSGHFYYHQWYSGNDYGADAHALVVAHGSLGTGVYGVAYGGQPDDNTLNCGLGDDRPYFVVTTYGILDDQFTFTHELGHNFGCSHSNSHCADGICATLGSGGTRKPIYSGETYTDISHPNGVQMWSSGSQDNCAHCMRSTWDTVAARQWPNEAGAPPSLSPGPSCLVNADCTAGWSCLDNTCTEMCANDGQCDDGNPCTVNTCDISGTQQCVKTVLSGHQAGCAAPFECDAAQEQCVCNDGGTGLGCCDTAADCGDGDACNGVYSCVSGLCQLDQGPVTCGSGEVCDPSDRTCSCDGPPSPSNNYCCDENNDLCPTVVDRCAGIEATCQGGTCLTLEPITCPSVNEECDPNTRTCISTCFSGAQCIGPNGVTCDSSVGCCMPDKKVCDPNDPDVPDCCPGSTCIGPAKNGSYKCG